MVDIENEVYTAIATALRAAYSGITVESITTYSPSKFPCVCIEETDNYALTSTRDTSSNENHVVVVYEVNVYSNKTSGRKSEAKAILNTVDGIMNDLGFTRLARTPINMDDATKYRLFARYRAAVSNNKTIFRR